MKKFRRFISVFLAFALMLTIFSSVSLVAFADSGEPTVEEIEVDLTKSASLGGSPVNVTDFSRGVIRIGANPGWFPNDGKTVEEISWPDAIISLKDSNGEYVTIEAGYKYAINVKYSVTKVNATPQIALVYNDTDSTEGLNGAHTLAVSEKHSAAGAYNLNAVTEGVANRPLRLAFGGGGVFSIDQVKIQRVASGTDVNIVTYVDGNLRTTEFAFDTLKTPEYPEYMGDTVHAVFGGWFDDAAFTTASGSTPADGSTYYAKWRSVTREIDLASSNKLNGYNPGQANESNTNIVHSFEDGVLKVDVDKTVAGNVGAGGTGLSDTDQQLTLEYFDYDSEIQDGEYSGCLLMNPNKKYGITVKFTVTSVTETIKFGIVKGQKFVSWDANTVVVIPFNITTAGSKVMYGQFNSGELVDSTYGGDNGNQKLRLGFEGNGTIIIESIIVQEVYADDISNGDVVAGIVNDAGIEYKYAWVKNLNGEWEIPSPKVYGDVVDARIEGWYTDSEFTTAFETPDDSNKKTVYYPKWEYGHLLGDWESDEENHWKVCTECGEEVDKAAHTEGDWIIDTPATTEAAGHRHKECTVCGKVLEEEDIPKLTSQTPGESTVEEIEVDLTKSASLGGSPVNVTDFSRGVIRIGANPGWFPNDGKTVETITWPDAIISLKDSNGEYVTVEAGYKYAINVKYSVTKVNATPQIALVYNDTDSTEGLNGAHTLAVSEKHSAAGAYNLNAVTEGVANRPLRLAFGGGGVFSIDQVKIQRIASGTDVNIVTYVDGNLRTTEFAFDTLKTPEYPEYMGDTVHAVFGGWFDDAAFTTASGSTPVDGSTYYAKWRSVTREIDLASSNKLNGYNPGQANAGNTSIVPTFEDDVLKVDVNKTVAGNFFAGGTGHSDTDQQLTLEYFDYDSEIQDGEYSGYLSMVPNKKYGITVKYTVTSVTEKVQLSVVKGQKYVSWDANTAIVIPKNITETGSGTMYGQFGSGEFVDSTYGGDNGNQRLRLGFEGNGTIIIESIIVQEVYADDISNGDVVAGIVNDAGVEYKFAWVKNLNGDWEIPAPKADGDVVDARIEGWYTDSEFTTAFETPDDSNKKTVYYPKWEYGHLLGDWESDVENHWKVCTECGEEADKAAHTEGDWIIDTPATAEAIGHKHKECTVCGYHTVEADIEQLSGEYTRGDINGDSVLNNKDLTRFFQYLSDWDVEVNEAALDVNGDGSVNNKDLTRLFQYLSDWDVEIF